MTVKRVEFLGFRVAGPRGRQCDAYKPSEWPGWTCEVEGDGVLLRGEGRIVEVPRRSCVIDWSKDAQAAERPRSRTVITAKAKPAPEGAI